MRALVTGAAGFIGSRLSHRLLDDGHGVVGVDCLTDYYDVRRKLANLEPLQQRRGFEHRPDDLRTADIDGLLDGIDVVFHQAGQPGVRLSWADGFATYVELNILVTQRLLEAARRTGLSRLVYASSSSVYGEAERYPTLETDEPQPRSPYGVTKLAAEHLCRLYAATYGVSTVSLRYFTVYGPGQRPDMAMQRLVEAAIDGSQFTLFGDGTQLRDFTFVDDIVAANVLAAAPTVPAGSVFNVAGGSSVTMTEVIATIEEAAARSIDVVRGPEQPGDVFRTGGDSTAARTTLGWAAAVSLEDGLSEHVRWYQSR